MDVKDAMKKKKKKIIPVFNNLSQYPNLLLAETSTDLVPMEEKGRKRVTNRHLTFGTCSTECFTEDEDS